MMTEKIRKKNRHYKKFIKVNFNDDSIKLKKSAQFYWVYDILYQNWKLLLENKNINPETYVNLNHLMRYLLVDNISILLKEPLVWNDLVLPQIKDFMKVKNVTLFRVNYENILSKNEKLSEIEREKYFNFHRYYQLVGSVFAAPFREGPEKHLYYKYGYLLTMFLVLSIFINVDQTLSSSAPFIIKIIGYKTAIYTLQSIDTKDFNSAIIMTNKKMKNINWKEVKPWKKV